MVTAALIVAIVLTIIELLKRKRRKAAPPEADERVIRNVFRYFAYISHIFVAIFMISLATFTLLGYESISLLYLWMFFFAYVWTAGLGIFIVKRK